MGMLKDPTEQVTHDEFTAYLTETLDYFMGGSNPYRVETAQIALKISQQIQNPAYFSNKKDAYECAKRFVANNSEERIKDVGELLYHSYIRLFREKNLSDEYRENRLKNRKNNTLNIKYVPKGSERPRFF
ncbi:MAG: hypothetical protein FWF59_13300 [Turicibacter sp.]|nr:hypothetical protein [Turicibacter sp.]